MRPNKLIMSAFGPYAGKVCVELDKLGENGLYLITGDTGAGKTTIFDAITYALFGEASGQTREPSMFRSKYAAPETPTAVELYFTYGKKEYYIKRNPEYERPKSRGEGYTIEKAAAELHLPDGRIVTKLKEVNSAVVEIMGIDRNQFTQISMIAQGDFLKLLLASTDERKKIFQKIFKTQNYFVLQERLKTESAKLGREYDLIKNRIEQYTEGIVCDDANPYFSEVCSAKAGNLTTEEIAELLQKLISADEISGKEINDKRENLQKELDEVKARIIKAEDVLSAKADFEKNEIDLKTEAEKEIDLKGKLKDREENLPKIKEFTEKAAAIKAFLPDYDELSKKQKDFNENKILIESGAENSQKAKAGIEALADEITALTEESKSLEKSGEEKLSLEAEKKIKEDECSKLEKLSKDINAAQELTLKSDKALSYYSKKQAEAELLDAELKEKTRIYLEAQAGILAETLTPNKPCPVCGSTTHPKIAIKPDDVPTKEELDEIQDRLNKANDIAGNARIEAGKLKGALNEKEQSVKLETKSLLGEVSFEEAKSIIAAKLAELSLLIEGFDTQIAEVQRKIKRKEKLDVILPEKKSALESAKEELSKIEDEVKAKKIENEALEKRIAELKAKLSFATKAEAETQIKGFSLEAENIQKAYDEVFKAVSENKEKLAALKSAKAEILKRISSGTEIDLDKEKENEGRLEKAQTELDSKSKEVHSRKTSNSSALDNIRQKLGEIKAVEENLTWMKALSATANGNLSGKEKIMLETYIQMTYFDKIISRANTRFMIMSGGQYELKRRKEAENNRSQSGLELDVIDHYNGTQRSVKTLSGGESFKASLSLALGLSDEIQSSAGGIKLDTMFVDEGFGSLDDESLAQAIKALSSLADGNRLVGIISHVSELKDKIDKQIIVKKEITGGSNISISV